MRFSIWVALGLAAPPAGPDDAPPGKVRFRPNKATVIWLLVCGSLLGIGWFKTINLILFIGYMLTMLFVVNLRKAARCAGRVLAERPEFDPVFCGEEFSAPVILFNPTTHPTTTIVVDHFHGEERSWFLSRFVGNDRVQVEATWKADRRGRHRMGPLLVDSSYPLGIIHAVRELPVPGYVTVLPPLGKIDVDMFRRRLIRSGAGDNPSRRPVRNSAVGSGDVRGLRAYRSGDSPRDVHWKSSARRNQLLVREYDKTEPLDLMIAVDPWLPAASPENLHRVEWVFSLAASLAVMWCQADDPTELTVILPGKPVVVKSGKARPTFARHVLAALADASGMAEVPPIPASEIKRNSNRAARILVSTRTDGPVARALREAGMPFVVVSAAEPPPWFVPPSELEHSVPMGEAHA